MQILIESLIMKALLTIIPIIFFVINVYSCECEEYNSLKELDSISYEWSDVVLVGNIFKIGTEYKIKVTEVLKGKIDNDTINGYTVGEEEVFNDCTFSPYLKGMYLLYFKKLQIKNGVVYYASQCLGSRSLDMKVCPVFSGNANERQAIQETKLWLNEMRTKL